MQFVHPWALLLLLPLAAFLCWTWPLVRGIAKARKKLVFGLRSVLLTLLVLALAQPQVVRPNVGLCTVFVVDRSASVSDQDAKKSVAFVNDALRKLRSDDMAAVVVVGKQPMIESMPAGERAFGAFESKVDATATDLAAGMRLAAGVFPEGKNRRIVLVTDGNETDGDVRDATLVCSTQGIQVDTFALGRDQGRAEASVVQLDAPGTSHADEPAKLRVLVDSNTAQNAMVDIERDGVPLKRIATHLDAGENAVVFEDKLSTTGFHRYRATLLPEKDTDPRNNLGSAFVSVRSRPRILLLQESTADRTLQQALAQSGVDVVLRGPDGAPVDAEEVAGFDAIVLNDFNAIHLLPKQMTMIEAAVRRSGTGLGMVGGDNSFIPGGYFGTPVADALPVDLDVRNRKEFPSTSVLIVVDASGSMGMVEDGERKIRLAAKAAEEAIKMFGPRDRIGVAGSSESISFIAPMQATQDRTALVSQLRKLDVQSGGIYAYMSVKFAKETLEKETTQVRHLILMGDGADVDTHEGTEALVAQMRLQKITTSTVAIGAGKDVEFLKRLALIGGGRFYLADRAAKLPAIATQDTATIARSAIEEGAFYPKLVGYDQVLNGIDSTPPLLANCLASKRPLANTSMLTQKDDPLFARWHYGLGSTFAFTSDAKPKWAKKWVGWPGYDAFWAQVARAVVRQPGQGDYQVSIDQTSGRAKAKVVARDPNGQPMGSLEGRVALTMPDGTGQDLVLNQTAPGTFEGSFDASALGTYILSVSEPDGSGGQRVTSSGFSVPYPPEYRTTKPQLPLLQEVAGTGGGQLLKAAAEAVRPSSLKGTSVSDIWTQLLFLALALIPVDVGLRRVSIPFKEIWAKMRARRARVAEPDRPIDRLQVAKARAKSAPGEPAHPTAQTTVAPTRSQPSGRPVLTGTGSAASKLLESKRKRQDK